MDMEAMMARIAEMVGLEGETDPEAIMEALEARIGEGGGKPDPREYVPMAAYKEAMEKTRKETQTASASRARAKVEEACAQGHITPAAREWALDLCMADEASFDQFLASSAAPFAHLGKSILPNAPAPRDGQPMDRDTHGPEVALLCEQLGLTPERFAD